MTIVLSCVTDDCVYQVSDRRLTSFTPPHAPIDDESNKAVFVNGRLAFGYSGISQVNGESTDVWLTKVAASAGSANDLMLVARTIRDQATIDFRRMTFARQYKRQAFQGVGWFADPNSGDLMPGVLTISNALDPKTSAFIGNARPVFELYDNFPKLRRHQIWLNSVGYRGSPEERDAIFRVVRNCAHRSTRRQHAMLAALVMCVRWLSGREGSIGPNLMAVSIPKRAAERVRQTGGSLSLLGGPVPNTATFLDCNTSGRTTLFAPNVVYQGSAATNVSGGPL